MAVDHLAAVQSGVVTKTNVIGIRKAINAKLRRDYGYSTGFTSPKLTAADIFAIEAAIAYHTPRVEGELDSTGRALLNSPRYRVRLDRVREIVSSLSRFRLMGYHRIGDGLPHVVPIYKACSPCGSFIFINVAWQSGGAGPEIISIGADRERML
jgi:hypothetical protein